jgi:hypothetical protein
VKNIFPCRRPIFAARLPQPFALSRAVAVQARKIALRRIPVAAALVKSYSATIAQYLCRQRPTNPIKKS